MEKAKKIFLDNKGVTGVDLSISLIIIAIFSGIIVMLMANMYRTSIEIQRSANAMAYATIVLEKVDEKPFEEIEDDFVEKLKSSGEFSMDDSYSINFSTDILEENLFKKIVVKINYEIGGEQKSITINKLKIKEIYKEWVKMG